MPDRPASLGRIVLGDGLEAMRRLAAGSVGLVYADPPFNTGSARGGRRVRTVRDDAGGRGGFGGHRYREIGLAQPVYNDRFADYAGWLEPFLAETRRVLADHGSLYLHLDWREAHRVKLLLDDVFGATNFLNEIIWAYDFGGRGRRSWAAKHDTILVYVRHAGRHHLDLEAVDRLPYMAPTLQTPERAARGKVPTDVWWHTIVPTSGRERTGYPTQKPLGILRRIVAASSRPDDLVMDWCAGSGTTGAACVELGRRFLLVDSSSDAVAVMRQRLGAAACAVDVEALGPAPPA